MTYPVGRRTALFRIAAGGAGAIVAPGWAESLGAFAEDHAHIVQQRQRGARTASWKPRVLSPAQNETVIVLSELIIPQTETPGAKAAKVNEFVDGVLADARPAQRESFLAGLAWLDARAQQDTGRPFAGATPAQQAALLETLSTASASGPDKASTDKAGTDFFLAIKSLTITGYYTSEVGMRQELGDDGTRFFPEFKGCTHPEHQ
jgi:hypothetical protein